MLQKQHLHALMVASLCSHLPTPTTKIAHFLFFYAFTWRIFPQIPHQFLFSFPIYCGALLQPRVRSPSLKSEKVDAVNFRKGYAVPSSVYDI